MRRGVEERRKARVRGEHGRWGLMVGRDGRERRRGARVGTWMRLRGTHRTHESARNRLGPEQPDAARVGECRVSTCGVNAAGPSMGTRREKQRAAIPSDHDVDERAESAS